MYKFLLSLQLTVLVSLSMLGGCASQHHQEQLQTELEVLKVQLARQQELLVRQTSIMENMGQFQQGEHENRRTFQQQLLGRLDALESVQTPDETESEEPECPIAVAEPVLNGENCTDLVIIGEIEYVRLSPPELEFEARIDTGATTSSMDARNIQTFERDGEDYVRFEIPNPDDDDKVELELPVVRSARIVQSSEEEGESRPVVEIQLELGPVKEMFEFTLTNREHLSYPVLIGRNTLRDLFVVDVGKKHSTQLSAEILNADESESEPEDD